MPGIQRTCAQWERVLADVSSGDEDEPSYGDLMRNADSMLRKVAPLVPAEDVPEEGRPIHQKLCASEDAPRTKGQAATADPE